MPESAVAGPELKNFVDFLAGAFKNSYFSKVILLWENLFFSWFLIAIIFLFVWLSSRKIKQVPQRWQCLMEIFVSGIDSFVCGIIGPKGRRFVPFIGTLFIYILFMNLAGLIPFMKSPTTSWSTTAALALCVFVYVQYTALRELGLFRYLDHLAGKPRGALAFTIVIPLLVFLTHILSELVRPLTLSLRLLGNISGDDIVIAALGSSGLIWIPLLLFNMLLSVLTAVVQAVVFCVLSTIYFSLVMPEVD